MGALASSLNRGGYPKETYVYHPIDSSKRQIRVLELLPGLEHDIIRANLHVTRLPPQRFIPRSDEDEDAELLNSNNNERDSSSLTEGTSVTYEAVSWCWGDPSVKQKIILDGVSFRAPYNAVEALRNFRFNDKPRTLWIDALCINQKNLEERSTQVAAMGQVYSNSAHTLIWLGASNDDEMAEKALTLCAEIALEVRNAMIQQRQPDLYELTLACKAIGDWKRSSFINTVFSSKWFSRLWVWQEATLSPKATCHLGRFSLPWDDVQLIAFWWFVSEWESEPVDRLKRARVECGQALFFPYTLFCSRYNPQHVKAFQDDTLSDLVTKSLYGIASDPRDKVYGLLGMTRWSTSGFGLPAAIKPDYTMSVRDCMRNATRVMIEESCNLECLADPRLHVTNPNSSKCPSWPSWVPRWFLSSAVGGPQSLFNAYNAHNGIVLSIDGLRNFNDGDILSLNGYEVDRIIWANKFENDIFNETLGIPVQFECLYHNVKNLVSITRRDFLVVLMAGGVGGGEINCNLDGLLEAFLLWFQDSCHLSAHCNNMKTKNASERPARFPKVEGTMLLVGRLREICERRRLFLTSKGRLGLGPSTLQKGDIVTVLFGGQ